jgi:tetratricopeptide (TPR) repeat protein
LRYRGELQVYIAIAIGGFVYLIVRYAALGGLLHGLNEHLSTDGLARVLLIAKTYGWYLLLTFYPFTLVSPAHPERIPLSASDPAAWLALVAVFGLLFAMYKLVCKKPHIGWSWAMFPVSLLPVAHGAMLQVTTNIVAERFLYYPLALASLALAPTLFAIARTMKEHVRSEVVRMVAAFIFLMYLGLSIASTRSMIPLWHDDIRLWTWALQRNPESAGAQANLANHYIVARQPQLGLRHAINALRISPKHAFAWSLVGNALADLGHCEDALRYQQVALGIKPLDTDTINSIGVILLQYGKLKAAEEFLQYGLVKNLWNRRINYNLIFVYLSLNDHNKAQVHLDHAWHALDETTKPKLATFEGNTAVNVPCTTSGSVLNSNADNSLFPKLDMGDTPPLWLLTPKQAATKYSISVSFDAGLIKVDMHPQ